MTDERLGYCGTEVRRSDPDRFLTALFAPPREREALFALYAFNQEVARTRESVTEPMLGEIRLQWWRDAVASAFEGRPVRHPVVRALADVVSAFALDSAEFGRLIDARVADLSDLPPRSVEDLVVYARGTAGTLAQIALQILGCRSDAAAAAGEAAGVAWALTGLLRALPFHVRGRRRYLPEDLVVRHRVSVRDVMELRASPELSALVRELADLADRHVAEARARRSAVGRRGVPALLICPLATDYLRHMRRTAYDPFDPAFARSGPLRAATLAVHAALGRY